MRLRSSRIIERALAAGGMAALLLAIGRSPPPSRGRTSPDLPRRRISPSRIAKAKDAAPKPDDRETRPGQARLVSTIPRHCKATP